MYLLKRHCHIDYLGDRSSGTPDTLTLPTLTANSASVAAGTKLPSVGLCLMLKEEVTSLPWSCD